MWVELKTKLGLYILFIKVTEILNSITSLTLTSSIGPKNSRLRLV